MTSHNSKTGNKPPVTLAEENLQLKEGLRNGGAYIQQLSRVLWLTVQAAGGRVTIDEATVDPLWRLDKLRLEDGKLVLTSSVTPPPNGEEIDRLVSKLMGTNLRIEAVQKELGLDSWPPDYLSFQIRDKLAIVNGHWIDAGLARGTEKPTGNN